MQEGRHYDLMNPYEKDETFKHQRTRTHFALITA